MDHPIQSIISNLVRRILNNMEKALQIVKHGVDLKESKKKKYEPKKEISLNISTLQER